MNSELDIPQGPAQVNKDIFMIVSASSAQERFRTTRLMSLLLDQTMTFLTKEIDLAPRLLPEEVEDRSTLRLHNFTAAIPIEGAVTGTVLLSVEDNVARAIMRSMFSEEIPEEEEALVLGEVMNEALNIIIGNAADSLAKCGLPIKIFPPYAAEHETAQAGSRILGNPASGRGIHSRAGLVRLLFTRTGEFC